MNIKNPSLYYLRWHDAHSASGWFQKDEVRKFINDERCIVEQTGWIINRSKSEIVMACRRMRWAKENEPEWGMLQKIPKTWIRKKKLVDK